MDLLRNSSQRQLEVTQKKMGNLVKDIQSLVLFKGLVGCKYHSCDGEDIAIKWIQDLMQAYHIKSNFQMYVCWKIYRTNIATIQVSV